MKNISLNRKYIKNVLIGLIILYPLAGAFFGLDLGDTGYHLYAFENLADNPEKINFTTFFTTVIGHYFGKIFGGMGLIAYNLLEVALEWGIVFIVYKTFKDLIGEMCVLTGSLIAVVAADAYLNIFNYHQFNALLLVIILCLEYRAIMEDRVRLSIFAGIAYVVLVFSRVGSVVAFVTLLLYVYDTIMNNKSWKRTWMHIAGFCLSSVAVVAAFVGILQLTGNLDFFMNNIFRLQGIASEGTTAYGFKNLLKTLIFENLNVMASGFIFMTSIAILIFAFNILYAKRETMLKKFFSVCIGLFISMIAVYQMYYAYDVNPAESWPQMTTGQRFVIGVMYVIAFWCYMCYISKKDTRSRAMTLFVLSSYMLVILTIAGSNTGTKHVILGMWLIAPVCVYTVRRIFMGPELRKVLSVIFKKIGMKMSRYTMRSVLVVLLFMFFAKYCHMIYYTFNYDCVDRTQLTATVDSDKVRGILTTQREADALNGTLASLEEYDEEQPLMVFGSSLLFYYLTERESYGAAWVTPNTYPLEKFEQDLADAKDEYGDTLPLVIYCRTNYSYGFEEELWEENIYRENLSMYDGKKDYFIEFLRENDYGIKYLDDYYIVLIPGSNSDFQYTEDVIRGTKGN